MKHIYDEQSTENMTNEQKMLIKSVEKLAKKLLGDDYEDFERYMDEEVVSITMTRRKTSIEIENIPEDSLLDIIFPNLMARILNFYEPKDRLAILAKVLKRCEDSKEELCQDED